MKKSPPLDYTQHDHDHLLDFATRYKGSATYRSPTIRPLDPFRTGPMTMARLAEAGLVKITYEITDKGREVAEALKVEKETTP